MFRFVGESGAIYEAPEPLAPLRRVAAAPDQPFVKASGEGDMVLGVTLDGKLLRFTGTGGFQQVDAKPADGRLFDVAMSSRGRALALSAPEALFTSGDGGVTWERARVPTIGVQRVVRTSSGSLLAEGPLGSYEWSDELPLTAAPPRPLSKSSSGRVHVDVEPVPSAEAVKYDGVAVLDDDRYAEVRALKGEKGTWRLLRGKIDGHLEVTPLPQSKSCSAVALGGRGKYLFTSCLSEDRAVSEVRRSADFGETWSAPLRLIASELRADIGVSPEGTALITGVCMPGVTNGGKCKPTTPLRVEVYGATLQATATVALELQDEAAYGPAYAVDGRSAYFLAGEVAVEEGPNHKHPDDLKLFVSHDNGKTFSARSVEVVMPEDRGSMIRDSYRDSHDSVPIAGLSPGADGTLGLWVNSTQVSSERWESHGGRIVQYEGVYLMTDADGRGLRQVRPPVDHAMLGGFGRRLIAFADARKEDGSVIMKLWESGDGGVTWKPKRLPDTLAKELIRQRTADSFVACTSGGCLVGEELTRVGWGGPSATARPGPATGASDNPSSVALTPIVCELSPGTPWASTAPLGISLDSRRYEGMPLPDARVAMRGRSVWSSLIEDAGTGSVSALSATLTGSGEGEARITTQPLLGPEPMRRHGRSWLIFKREREMAGYVVVRAILPTGEYGDVIEDMEVRTIDVGWENYMAGTSGHRRIPATVTSTWSLGTARTYLGYEVVPRLAISLNAHGVVVMPEGSSERSLSSFVIDTNGHTELVPHPFRASPSLGDSGDLRRYLSYAQMDLVEPGSSSVGALMRERSDTSSNTWHFNDSTSNAIVVLLGSPTGSGAPFTFTPSGDSLARAYASDAYWTYAGKTTLGLVSYVVEKRKGRAYASFYALRADGTLAPPVPVATLSDLGDQPRACTAGERATSARLVSAMHWEGRESEVLFPGLRHPVLVRDAKGQGAVNGSAPVSLLTGATVTHGTPSTACVAAWEAKSPTNEVSAIISGDLTHSWIFRLGKEQCGSMGECSRALEYRPMSCHFDPSARATEGAGK